MRLDYPPNDEQEDTEDYMEHEHFEDIQLPERDNPAMTFDQEDNLNVRNVVDTDKIDDYTDDGLDIDD